MCFRLLDHDRDVKRRGRKERVLLGISLRLGLAQHRGGILDAVILRLIHRAALDGVIGP
jgi:hypothetical protein